jgi:hypothetical protein
MQPVLFESKLKIARGTCSPRLGTEISYFSSSVCSGHPMGRSTGIWHAIPHRRAAQFECDSSRRSIDTWIMI